jgi:glutamine synthetase
LSQHEISVEAINKDIRDMKIDLVAVSYVDFSGVSRAKARPAKYAGDLLRNGIKFAKANFGLSSFDIIVPDSGFTVASGEAKLFPDLTTFAVLPCVSGIARFMGDLKNLDGTPWDLCPRSSFKRVLADAEALGYSYAGGAEMEFNVVRLENGKPIPYWTGGTVSQHGLDISSDLVQDFIHNLESANVHITKAHVEGGGALGGQFELDILHNKGVKCADDVVAFRDIARAVAKQHGFTASFLAKLGDQFTGSGMHLHSSLVEKESGKNLFADPDDDRGLGYSQTAYYFIGGLLEHARALCAVLAPNVNSYRRLVPRGRWAADAIGYGPNHRGLAVRLTESEQTSLESANIELRIPDPSGNPYLGFACLLAAGLDGIRKRRDPGDPVTFDLSNLTAREMKRRGMKLLPKSLFEALEEFENDSVIREVLGSTLFDEYLNVKHQEWEMFASHVTDWEIERMLNII